jgi:hypothetical protein
LGAVLEKLALTCRVTLVEGAIITLRPLKVAVEPVKVVVPAEVTLFKRVSPVIPVEALPVPASVIVRLVRVIGILPELLTKTWTTGRLVTPASWLELGGIEGPEPTEAVEGVEVIVGVDVAVFANVGLTGTAIFRVQLTATTNATSRVATPKNFQ